MKTKHTQGEWVVTTTLGVNSHENGSNVKNICIQSEVQDGKTYEEREANAKLIAAAPELLEALKGLYDFAEKIAMRVPSDEWNEKFREKFNPIMTDAEFAIKKATE